MKFLFYLSGEHPSLPKSEIDAVFFGEGIDYEIEYEKNRLLVVDAKTNNFDFINRFALVKDAAVFIYKGKSIHEAAVEAAKKISCENYETFAVRCRALDCKNSMEVERELGEKIGKLSGFRVELKNPKVTVSCFTDGCFFAGIKLKINQKFSSRKAQHRPYFSPVSMDPKIARIVVNLTRIKTGANVLDPFSGTGGILIEAGLMGMKIFGSDIDERMVDGCIENLKFYGICGEIRRADALNLKENLQKPVDAIATDPPYGKSSFTSNKNLAEFYKNFLDSAAQILDAGKFMVIVLPHEYKLNFKGFTVREFHDVRMHKSLTRRIWVLERE